MRTRRGGCWAGGAASDLICRTMYAWREAISPHLAAEKEGGAVPDNVLLEVLGRCLGTGFEDEGRKVDVWTVVETAGGVASPGPSSNFCRVMQHKRSNSKGNWCLEKFEHAHTE